MTAELPRQSATLDVDELGTFKTALLFNRIYKYTDDDIIGEGAFGSVYRSHHVSNPDYEVAVKITDARSKQDALDTLQEVEFLRRLRDVPHIVRLVDFYVENKQMYSVQDLANGGDVLDRLIERGTYTERDTRLLAGKFLSAMDCIHKNGIVHRDLKLENLLLKDADNDHDILLCDFGCAKFLPDDENELLYTMCGTDAYVAPEVVIGDGYREKAEFWSVGCVIYYLLAGYLPFGDTGEPDLYPRIMDADFDFEHNCWDNITDAAKDLLCFLFKLNESERFSAEEALQSNWFSGKCTAITRRTTAIAGATERLPDANTCGSFMTSTATLMMESSATLFMASTMSMRSMVGPEDTDADSGSNDVGDNDVIPIQAIVRGFLDRRRFVTIKKQIAQVQAIVRGFLEQRHYQASIQQIVRIQALVRGFVDRAQYQRSTRRIMGLQAIARGFLRRANYQRSTSRIIYLQAIIRGFIARASYEVSTRRIVHLQAIVRGFIGSNTYKASIRRIVHLQAMARGFLDRESYEASTRRIVYLQAIVRGFVERMNYKVSTARIVHLQAMIRGFVCRTNYKVSTRRIIHLQAAVRGFLDRAKYEESAKSAVLLQAIVRGFVYRMNYERSTRSIIHLQAMVRGFLDRSNYKLTTKRIVLVQAMIRGYRDLTNYQLSRARVIHTQAIVRGFLGRSSTELIRLFDRYIAIEESAKKEVEQINKNKERKLKTLQKQLKFQRQQQKKPCLKDDEINQAMDLIEEFKEEYDFLTACRKKAMKCNRNLQRQQDQFIRSIKDKNNRINELKLKTDELRRNNERLEKTSSLLHDVAHALIQRVNDDIRMRHQERSQEEQEQLPRLEEEEEQPCPREQPIQQQQTRPQQRKRQRSLKQPQQQQRPHLLTSNMYVKESFLEKINKKKSEINQRGQLSGSMYARASFVERINRRKSELNHVVMTQPCRNIGAAA